MATGPVLFWLGISEEERKNKLQIVRFIGLL